MEPLLISIAEDNISKMWENMEDDTILGFLDHSRIEDNFRYGFIAIGSLKQFRKDQQLKRNNPVK